VYGEIEIERRREGKRERERESMRGGKECKKVKNCRLVIVSAS
jgi:hypothetical protein